uniref:Uncharacterized protein n=1 Tax=Chromera velia CCMP2878 TaxID=1169474 RepID=A0A0G4FVE6_9ALVE|eukprot:Cvel_18979.t1-p1 / transcript=Cvel_18979.t1 / gene=Cvel_18979 / organism=Chromera_velia_CCMP2878 / gene_product=hypothetical protein / transcript_product=hypothetical protein / location=Cvel_scaffold1604:38820-39931(-) / protein_length=84 / sequence_SO=supercontig / SO=protein_coding / is_pseudo=false
MRPIHILVWSPYKQLAVRRASFEETFNFALDFANNAAKDAKDKVKMARIILANEALKLVQRWREQHDKHIMQRILRTRPLKRDT